MRIFIQNNLNQLYWGFFGPSRCNISIFGKLLYIQITGDISFRVVIALGLLVGTGLVAAVYEESLYIDIRKVKRSGRLFLGQRFLWQWSNVHPSISAEVMEDSFCLDNLQLWREQNLGPLSILWQTCCRSLLWG